VDFFIIKPTRCTNFPNLLRRETLHVSCSSSARRQEFIHCTLSIDICRTVFEQDQDGTVAGVKPVWYIPVPNVQWINSWWWAEELSETWRVSCRNKFGKLVHLVGFSIKKFVTMYGHMNVKNCGCYMGYRLIVRIEWLCVWVWQFFGAVVQTFSWGIM
jgi:hypothetical protein